MSDVGDDYRALRELNAAKRQREIAPQAQERRPQAQQRQSVKNFDDDMDLPF